MTILESVRAVARQRERAMPGPWKTERGTFIYDVNGADGEFASAAADLDLGALIAELERLYAVEDRTYEYHALTGQGPV